MRGEPSRAAHRRYGRRRHDKRYELTRTIRSGPIRAREHDLAAMRCHSAGTESEIKKRKAERT